MKPMLSGKAVIDRLTFPLLASPKLDGIRALVVDGVLISRRIKPIPNTYVQRHLGRPKLNGLDGELVISPSWHPQAFHRTTSAVMSEDGIPRVSFWVFDRFDMPQEAFVSRFASLPPTFDADPDGQITVRKLQQVKIATASELLDYEATILAKGYEGIMLRDPMGTYKFGRASARTGELLKLKRFEDSEALVLSIDEQMRNDNEAVRNALGTLKRSSHKANRHPKGTTGSLRVRDLVTGIEFEIGTGMDEATRAEFWANPPVGKIVKYRFQPTGIKEKPRFPVFLGIRED